VNQLADQLSSSDVPAARQTTLDAQVRSRIQQELSRLREEEQSVREEIERTLEKENLDKERSMAGAENQTEGENSSGAGNVKSGPLLLGDVDEVRKKVDRFNSKREQTEFTTVRSLGEDVVKCYQYVWLHFLREIHKGLNVVRNNPTTTLDCWREVTKFKQAVDAAEQVRRFLYCDPDEDIHYAHVEICRYPSIE
jgi:altered-inheritance-of-mitochondria protein 13